MEAISCPQCGGAAGPEDVDPESGRVTCSFCGSLFFRTRAAEGGAPTPLRRRHAPRPHVALPDGIGVREEGSGLVLDRRWFRGGHVFLLVFGLVWCGFLVFWYSIAFASGAVVMMLFPLLHVAVGIGVLYAALAGFLNTTTIEVRGRRLRVRHGPLPWKGAVDLDAGAVTQLYCRAKVRRGKNGSTTQYEIQAVDDRGVRRPVLRGLDEEDQALFIEQELERHLGLEDLPVAGELS